MSCLFQRRLPWLVSLVLATSWLAVFPLTARAAASDDPKEAARAFFKAVLANDVATIRSTTIGTEMELATIESMAAVITAQKKLADAAKEKFGDDAKSLAVRTVDFNPLLNDADVKLDGNEAIIMPKATNSKPMKLRKVDGQWKIELSTMQLSGQRLPPDRVRQLSTMMEQVSADVRAGKFNNFQELQMELEKRRVAIVSGGAATQPSPR